MVGDDEAFHLEPLDEEEPHVGQCGRRAFVGGDETADRDPGEIVEPPQRLLERFAADILEQSVDAVRQRGLQVLGEVRRLVVDAGVIAELLDGVGAFLRSAGDPDRPRAGELGKLADDRADRPGRRRDQHRFARSSAR